MGFGSLMADPKKYLGHHKVQVGDNNATATALTESPAQALANGRTGILFTQTTTNYLTMIHTVGYGQNIASTKAEIRKAVLPFTDRIFRQFQPLLSPVDVGFRYLPFRQNQCTYTALDPAAQFFITGPLSGCTIGVIKFNGIITVFHSNDNIGAGAAARATQRQSINDLCALYGMPFQAVTLCEYGTHYHGLGFVFGRLRGGTWKFYSHATSQGGTTRTIKWAEV